ncbi:DUF4159 domain-containing protein [Psychroflexus sp. ALD_RP9]|uniref:DUF4159 domain-containing protein n=1 Tax=Psychroflexus sp. ALD_RP9 TaxID=2777186 RepID=UPI001A8D480F|nr:DUF4159 domain-containing protein [Psychroflexus sp. ALD_RP9]QSS97315.1 DUF4159 domain-containing protein [Psychroflexus sp. ALD_RP9]
MKFNLNLFLILFASFAFSQNIAVLKYNGGGDWYSNPTALPNLVKFSNAQINTKISPQIAEVKASSPELFSFPYVYMTGHGNVFFSPEDIKNLRLYLKSGGFLHIDDNYGLDQYIRPELKKLFPDKTLELLPANHPIFNRVFNFPNGLPKIHEHDGKPPQAYGIFEDSRLILLYTHESDLGNGWEDQAIHNDPEEVRLKALKMGTNILHYIFVK